MGHSGWRASSYQVTRSRSGVTGDGRQIDRRPARVRQPIRGPGRPRRFGRSVSGGAEVEVDLAGDVALQAADDLCLGQAFGGAPFGVGAGRRVRAHPGDHDAPQGVVGLPVTTGVEAVPFGLAGGGRDRGGAAQVRPGGFAAQPFGVVPGGDQSSAAVSVPTPCRASSPGACPVTRGTMSASRQSSWPSRNSRAAPARAARSGCRSRRRAAGPGPQRRQLGDQVSGRVRGEPGAQVFGAGHDQARAWLMAWVRSARAALATISARIASTAPSRPFDAPRALPDWPPVRADRVQRVGFALPAAVLPVRAVHLDDPHRA